MVGLTIDRKLGAAGADPHGRSRSVAVRSGRSVGPWEEGPELSNGII